jgi:transcriptional regulator with XRE-family HTH domain
MVRGEHLSDRGRRLARRSLQVTGEELREARLRPGLTQREVGAAVGISHTEVGRIELGKAPRVPFETLVMLAAVLGLDLPLRVYPSGEPIRDAAQLALLAKLRTHLAPGLGWRTEVPLRISGDRRAWDAAIIGSDWNVPIDAESRLRDVQACSRRTALKRRDDRQDVVILPVADTRNNRRALRLAALDLISDFPLRGAQAIASLEAGMRPSASAIVVL